VLHAPTVSLLIISQMITDAIRPTLKYNVWMCERIQVYDNQSVNLKPSTQT
jgi:hypothetical protein